MIQTYSKVYSWLFVVLIPLYLSLQLLKANTNISTTLQLFNHTFPKSNPHSNTWTFREHWPLSQPKRRRTQQNTDEKYLTFFTHSGFQNQLIQVENGILLAWYLNRTLILPKAVLGQAFGWSHFERLYQHHTLRDTSNPFCARFTKKKDRKLASCPDPNKYALASFEDLFDLSWAKQHVRIEQRDASDFHWLQYHYGIHTGNHHQSHGSYVDGDIFFFKDETRYDWRIYDMPNKYKFLGRYADSLQVEELQNHSEKLIHFTSLFGTGKFSIKNPQNMQFFKSLQNSITYRHPAVLKISHSVIGALGGSRNFLGVHLRTADGLFIDAVPENIQNIIQRIPATSIPLINTTDLPLSTCVTLAQQNQTTLVFLATDAIQPRSNPQFQPLWSHSPCTFTLNEILPPQHPTWHHVDAYRTHTGESMRRFLTPLMDALVASQGSAFIGSKGSTFSGYIRRLHHTKRNVF
ncbi:uncharacterized protein EV154DRAFT_514129 [Mucor mucedo]|uniref:uncharacterized protein n=1 Tax=Mucor mucedo TaxID=29922 RepID=UPI00221E536D|nr:uncharacterized protein EV154DRAFT_514129 [Mucor mucedo]KAI7889547.1 hypothetical protein EV154DRAFT_514129 [Mucor mucedo]